MTAMTALQLYEVVLSLVAAVAILSHDSKNASSLGRAVVWPVQFVCTYVLKLAVRTNTAKIDD